MADETMARQPGRSRKPAANSPDTSGEGLPGVSPPVDLPSQPEATPSVTVPSPVQPPAAAEPGHRAFLEAGLAQLLERVKLTAAGQQPTDTDNQAQWPLLWAALNQRQDAEGKPVKGASFNISSDGSEYVAYITFRHCGYSTAIRSARLDTLFDLGERVLSDPGTKWRVFEEQGKGKKK